MRRSARLSALLPCGSRCPPRRTRRRGPGAAAGRFARLAAAQPAAAARAATGHGRSASSGYRGTAQPVRANAGTSSQFGGRWSSVSGDPARFQRYQDLRDGVLFTDARFAREDPDGNWLFRAAADNVGWRDQRYFGQLRADRPLRDLGPVGRDPAVLQRRYEDAVHAASDEPAAPRRCDAARDSERPGAHAVGVPADRLAVRSARAARHRQRQPRRDADARTST